MNLDFNLTFKTILILGETYIRVFLVTPIDTEG